MSEVSKSPHQNEISSSEERHTFQRDAYLKSILKNGKSKSDPDVQDQLVMYEEDKQRSADRVKDPKWWENNLEYDLRSTQWILEKARNDEVYAQHIYAALCNTEWQRTEPWPILKNETWSCSWRRAGGIVADMLEKGDYIDWYCSGMVQEKEDYSEWIKTATTEQIETYKKNMASVGEGTVTDEIREDFLKLGWQLLSYSGES